MVPSLLSVNDLREQQNRCNPYEIYSNPNKACEILSQTLKQRLFTSEVGPKIEMITELLADFTPTNMLKLR